MRELVEESRNIKERKVVENVSAEFVYSVKDGVLNSRIDCNATVNGKLLQMYCDRTGLRQTFYPNGTVYATVAPVIVAIHAEIDDILTTYAPKA